jgi:hypothetical protein
MINIMKIFTGLAASLAASGLLIATAANATTVTFTEGGAPGGTAGVISAIAPTTFDFDAGIPGQFTNVTAGAMINPTGNVGIAAPPFGDTTRYLSIGSAAPPTETALLTLSAPVTYLGLYWGSVDTYNTISFLDALGNTITTTGLDTSKYTGSDILNPANGFQGDGGSAYVNFFFTGGEVSKVLFSSDQKAFEIDNIAAGVPEASTWAMMILGFLGLGFLGYRRSSGSSNPTFRMA